MPTLNSGEYALQLKVFSADGHLNEDLIRFVVTKENR
jgi:methionine-rich copper-binding protein CopC